MMIAREYAYLASLRNDDFRTFLPKSKKKSIRQAALCLAFEKLGISEWE